MRNAMLERIIIGAIAFGQFSLSLFLLVFGFYALPLLLFGLWGLISSFTLLSASSAARKSAIIWYIVLFTFAAYGTAKVENLSLRDPLQLWALFSLAAIFYLGYLVKKR